MKKLKPIFISMVILLPLIFGFLLNPPAPTDKEITNCQQRFCVTPPQVTQIHIYHIKPDFYYVGYCTTDSTGCCPDAASLIEGDGYNAKPTCQPYVQGTDFTACYPNPLIMECE